MLSKIIYSFFSKSNQVKICFISKADTLFLPMKAQITT